MPSLVLTLEEIWSWWSISYCCQKLCFRARTLLVKRFHPCLSISTYPSCLQYTDIQPVPKKVEHSNPLNYRPIALISCLFNVFESLLNRKIQKHLSAHNLLSNCQCSFRSERSNGDLLAFIPNLGHPLLKVSVKLCCCFRYMKKLLIEFGTRLWFQNFALSVSTLLSVPSFLICFLTVLLQLW